MKYFYSLLLIAIGFASCKTNYRISVQEPARIKLQDSVDHIGIINNITNENSPEKKIGQILGTESINGNVMASERAVDGLMRGIEQSNYMQATNLQAQALHFEGGETNWTVIDSICAANNLHAIIELVEIRSISPVGGTVLANATGQTSNRLEGWLYVNVYEAGTHLSIERFSIRRYYNIPMSGSTNIVAVLGDIQRKREYYRALGWELGYGAGKLIYPNWVWVSRNYYNSGSQAIKTAKPMLRQGNWDLAQRTLARDLDHRKAKVRGRILYNMALAYEGQGMIDLAIETCEKSAMEGNKEANEYLVKLRRRKALMDQI